jgi:hypothetical protein
MRFLECLRYAHCGAALALNVCEHAHMRLNMFIASRCTAETYAALRRPPLGLGLGLQNYFYYYAFFSCYL